MIRKRCPSLADLLFTKHQVQKRDSDLFLESNRSLTCNC